MKKLAYVLGGIIAVSFTTDEKKEYKKKLLCLSKLFLQALFFASRKIEITQNYLYAHVWF
jgi:hypothetical protein